jgi:type II secretory pathway component PulF
VGAEKSLSLLGSAPLSEQQVLLNQILFSLEAGQSLEKSLEFLKNQKLSKSLKDFVQDFHFYLKRGYGGFSHRKFLFQKYFHPSLVPYLALGIERQQFGPFLKSAIKMAQQLVALRGRLLQLCLYPVILMLMMFVFLGIALGYLIPQMKTLFIDMNLPVPKLILWLDSLPGALVVLFLVLGVLIFIFRRIDAQGILSHKIKNFLQMKLMKVSFIYILYFLPFLSAWVSFLKAGLNEEEAVACALSLLPEILREDYCQLSQGLKAGYPLGDLINALENVPQVIRNHIQASAKNENLVQALDFLQIYLEDNQNKTVQLFFTWAEPLLMILMGSVVAGFLMLIFMPFINLSQNYGVTL